MDAKELIQKIFHKKVKDYSFLISFFLIFSFFVMFAIRPNLVSVFSSQKELSDLKSLDNEYGKVIMDIIESQALIEQYRDQVYLLDEAIPNRPLVNEVIEDIENAARDSNIVLTNIDIAELELKEEVRTNTNTSEFKVYLETMSSFEDTIVFVNLLKSQRRLKLIDNFTIVKEGTSVLSNGLLNLRIELTGHYL